MAFSLFGGDNPLNDEKVLSVDDWKQLFEESRRQAVTALLYDALLMLPKEQRPSRSVLFHFLSMTQTIERDNKLRHQALVAFQDEVMQPLGLPTVVVKGSAIARQYPNPLHRECGDNDLYTGSDTESIARRLESLGIEVDRKDPRHISFIFHDVDFECHSYLLYHNDDPKWLNVPIHPETATYALPLYQHLFFLAKHMEHHAVFFHNPIRLRDLIDWCILLRSGDFDIEALRKIKSGTDVDLFIELMTLYCNKLFGTDFPCQVPDTLVADDFDLLYMQCPERHRLAIVRVARRSWKYIRYGRKYRAIYGQSMFRRFYINNVWVAMRNKLIPA